MVEFLSVIIDAKFFLMNVHAGITEQEVIDFVKTSSLAKDHPNQKVILFFDEVNIKYFKNYFNFVFLIKKFDYLDEYKQVSAKYF